MVLSRCAAIVAAALISTCGTALAIGPGGDRKAHIPGVHHTAFMRTFGETAPPLGYLQFCRLHPRQCEPKGGPTRRVHLSKTKWIELGEVNELVNAMIVPATDAQLYGVSEFWTIPLTHGDCEDYVLLKRSLLIERGWPESALLITVVRDELDEGHAVLTVRTHLGDLVLDNKHSAILNWRQTGYRFIKRQSFRDPSLWVSLTPSSDALMSAAGPRR